MMLIMQNPSKISVAPMMDYTDRHARYFLRLIAPDILLYTEMITALALRHGDRDYLLGFHPDEHPVALQLGGSDPQLLAECAKMGEDFGYCEINLNVGCPSPRVSSGKFGACLMLEPHLVADCIAAMQQQVKIPVTVKCRIGVDHQDDYAALCRFINTVSQAGCETFIIHARKAWLKGLSPKQNRDIPPLQYEVVWQIKQAFPHLNIMINGGIKTLEEIKQQLAQVDGVMIGRGAYFNPYFLAHIQHYFYPDTQLKSRYDIAQQYIPYLESQCAQGHKFSNMLRHVLGLFQGQRGAAIWRRYLSEHARHADSRILEKALELVGSSANNTA
jgi:tRNA-dihydrouridine synthase A